jgi:hypothetical protein
MENLKLIFNEALEKYEASEKIYGVYDPATDTRDLLHEAQDEILDAINYLGMHLIKMRRLNGCGNP